MEREYNIDFNKVNFKDIQKKIFEYFYDSGLLFKFLDYQDIKQNQFKNISDFISYIKDNNIPEVRNENDMIINIFTRGECFMFSRILYRYLEKKGINVGILLLMNNTGNINNGGFESVEIDHAVIFYGNDIIDIRGVITNNIINNRLYYSIECYINSIFSKNNMINYEKISDLITYNYNIDYLENLEWLYYTDFEEY